uniref:C-type lectin domain-containing protein n=1 Tax=Echeneis naucrates TaxID=173247 RepID=A0A665TR76_ECHNA
TCSAIFPKDMHESVTFFICIRTGFGVKQDDICKPICSGNECITVHQDRVDFETAEEACRVRNGELVTIRPQADKRILGRLSQELSGNFWIGLRLPAGTCSNLSAPLRGYEWNSGSKHGSFIPSLTTWRESFQVCSPHCVSLSDDQKWTERPCSDRTDGYLCRTKHKDACKTEELSHSDVFLSQQGCSDAPCEHLCTAVNGGYKCSCFEGYIIDSDNPTMCKVHCEKQSCPLVCEGVGEGGPCKCADGFIDNVGECIDINECEMDQCQQKCENTFGSFMCSCDKGFVLKDQVKCVKARSSESFVMTTPIVTSLASVASINYTQKASSVSPGSFLGLWVFAAVAVVVSICALRFYVVKRQKHNQQSTAVVAAANTEC